MPEYFINPYNFVPITNECKKDIDAETKKSRNYDVHTGYFECTLITKTPLAIPDIAEAYHDNDVQEHIHYPFMRVNNNLTIPASSLRGPIRSVYETLTNSCMVTMDSNEHITKRVAAKEPYEPCVIKKVKISNDKFEWKLYKAKRIPLVCNPKSDANNYSLLESDEYTKYTVKQDDGVKYIEYNEKRFYWGDEVKILNRGPGHIKIKFHKEVWNGSSAGKIDKGLETNCFLYLGEMIRGKHAESIFEIIGKPLPFSNDIIDNALNGLENTLQEYRNNSINKNIGVSDKEKTHYGYKGYERAKEKGVIPIWFKEISGKLYLSLAAIGRIAYSNKLMDISNGHDPCRDRKNLCPACSVFGMAGENSLGSRVSFTDAVANERNDVLYEKEATLKELGSPRTSYLQFYSTGGKEYDSDGATIRGRKFYWHIPVASEKCDIYSTAEKTKRNATYELVRPEKRFAFKVYYNHLSSDEKNMLLWSISLGENKSKIMHKIGHGKPLGLGSVKICVDKCVERSYESGDYSTKTVPFNVNSNDLPRIIDKDAWEAFSIIGEYNSGSARKICYPYLMASPTAQSTIDQQTRRGYTLKENVLASHKWFKDNTDLLPDITSQMISHQVKVIETVQIPKDFERNNNGHGGGKRFQENKEYEGAVSNYDDRKTKAFISIPGYEKKAQVHFRDIKGEYGKIDKKLPIGATVRIKYLRNQLGSDGRLHDKWELI